MVYIVLALLCSFSLHGMEREDLKRERDTDEIKESSDLASKKAKISAEGEQSEFTRDEFERVVYSLLAKGDIVTAEARIRERAQKCYMTSLKFLMHMRVRARRKKAASEEDTLVQPHLYRLFYKLIDETEEDVLKAALLANKQERPVSLLELAIMTNDTELVTYLIKKKSIDIDQVLGLKLMMVAFKASATSIIMLLHDAYKVSIIAIPDVFHKIAGFGTAELLDKAVAEYCQKYPEAKNSEPLKILTTHDASKNTPLLIASGSGNVSVVERLVTYYKLDPLIHPSALHQASYHPSGLPVLKFFIETLHKDKNAISESLSLLHAAASAPSDNTEVLKYLLDDCAMSLNVKDKIGDIPLHRAAERGSYENFIYLVKKKPTHINIANNEGLSTIHLAARSSVSKLDYIIKEKREYPEKSAGPSFIVPLHQACSANCLANVKLLCETYKVNKNAQDVNGNTPLHIAAVRGLLDILKYLLDQGALKSCRDKKGATILHKAVAHVPVLRFLLESGLSSINERNQDGLSVLQAAIQRGLQPSVRFLLDYVRQNSDCIICAEMHDNSIKSFVLNCCSQVICDDFASKIFKPGEQVPCPHCKTLGPVLFLI
jgi:ankyrin repeat protein